MSSVTSPDQVIKSEIFAYIDQRFPALAPVKADTPLLDGAIDSLGFLELIMFLGERFKISVEDEGFDFQELATPASLVNFVQRSRT